MPNIYPTRAAKRPEFPDVPPSRRKNMAAIKGKNTKPEMVVRRLLHGLGYRYRLHVKDLPGCPDVVFPRRRKVIDVMGCFWHRHPACKFATTPVTRAEFWQAKFKVNVERDARNHALLKEQGWSLLVIWECEVSKSGLSNRLEQHLNSF
jgi:DNA mismatch endonuclease Vsr